MKARTRRAKARLETIDLDKLERRLRRMKFPDRLTLLEQVEQLIADLDPIPEAVISLCRKWARPAQWQAGWNAREHLDGILNA